MKLRGFIAVFGVIAALVFLLFATGAIPTSPSGNSGSAPALVNVVRSSCVRPAGFLLIIADLSGFNDSIAHGAPANPWPVIQVRQGDIVRLLVCNEDPSQAHGFAIQTYFDSGVVLAPGDAFRIQFPATTRGTFVIYCNIFCTVHVFMVGRLIVS